MDIDQGPNPERQSIAATVINPWGKGSVPKTLDETVREKLHPGSLPRPDPLKVCAGMGSDKPRTACEQPILLQDGIRN
jgi:hypothetical protein